MVEHDLVLNKLNAVLEDFIKLDPKKQRWFMSALARKADSLNRKRVTKQVNLDGSKYKGRKRATKKKMFRELKKRKNMVIRVDGDTATLQHKGWRTRLAYEHHYGVSIPKKYQSRSTTIGRGKKNRVKGDDPCTYEQAGILASFVFLNKEGLEPETRVSMDEIHKTEQSEKTGRAKRKAIVQLFRSRYTAAEAGNVIALWDQNVSRKTSSRTPRYNLPSRHLLGLSNQDLPELVNYAEQRLAHYLRS